MVAQLPLHSAAAYLARTVQAWPASEPDRRGFALPPAVSARVPLQPGQTGTAAVRLAGGALLYVIMLYGFAPLWNTEIVNFTPRVPFFLSHLLFGAAVGGWVYWQIGYAGAGMRLHAHRPRLGGAA